MINVILIFISITLFSCDKNNKHISSNLDSEKENISIESDDIFVITDILSTKDKTINNSGYLHAINSEQIVFQKNIYSREKLNKIQSYLFFYDKGHTESLKEVEISSTTKMSFINSTLFTASIEIKDLPNGKITPWIKIEAHSLKNKSLLNSSTFKVALQSTFKNGMENEPENSNMRILAYDFHMVTTNDHIYIVYRLGFNIELLTFNMSLELTNREMIVSNNYSIDDMLHKHLWYHSLSIDIRANEGNLVTLYKNIDKEKLSIYLKKSNGTKENYEIDFDFNNNHVDNFLLSTKGKDILIKSNNSLFFYDVFNRDHFLTIKIDDQYDFKKFHITNDNQILLIGSTQLLHADTGSLIGPPEDAIIILYDNYTKLGQARISTKRRDSIEDISVTPNEDIFILTNNNFLQTHSEFLPNETAWSHLFKLEIKK